MLLCIAKPFCVAPRESSSPTHQGDCVRGEGAGVGQAPAGTGGQRCAGVRGRGEFSMDLPELHDAARAGNSQRCAEVGKAPGVVLQRDSRGRSAMHWAAQCSTSQEVIEVLASLGANMNAKDNRNRTPLHYAVEAGRRVIVHRLLALGSDPCAEFDAGITALQLSTRDGRRDLVIDLLKAGAGTETFGNFRTALQSAVVLGHVEIVQDLIKAGADVNRPYPDLDQESGKTPLMVAAMRGYREVVEELLNGGGDIDLRDYSGKKAWDHALEASQMGVQRAEEVKVVLLSQSTSRVVAGGDSIDSLTAKSLLFGGLVGGYANLASDSLVAVVLYVNEDYWYFSLMVICIALPAILHTTVQLSKGFYASAARSFFFCELLHASVESYRTSTKTSTFMTLKFFETAMQCIPSAVLKLHSFLSKWNSWSIKEGSPAVVILMCSTGISLLTAFHTVAIMAVENGDSIWRDKLKGGSPLTKVASVAYFGTDGLLHLVIYAVMSYTHYERIWAILFAMVFCMWVLLAMGFARPNQGLDKSFVMVLARAAMLSPLMSVVDFPIKPNQSGGRGGTWLLLRAVVISTIVLWVCSFMAVLKPDQSLSDLDHNLPRDFIVGISAIYVCKCLSLAYMMSRASELSAHKTLMGMQFQLQDVKKHSTFSALATTAERNLQSDTSIGHSGMHITRNPLHSVSEDTSSALGLPGRLAVRSRGGTHLQSTGAPASPTVRHNPLV